MNRSSVASLSLLSLFCAVACGSVSPLATDGGAGKGGGQAGADGGTGAAGAPPPSSTGTAGATGSAGATGTAGATGSAGATGTAGASGTAGAAGTAGAGGHGGTTGAGGMSGRVPMKHRAAASACSPDRVAGTCTTTPIAVPDAGLSCRKDTDCTSGTNGRCSLGGRVLACACTYDACAKDADCATDGPCECRTSAPGIVAPPTSGDANVCKAGNCRVDKDCLGGAGYCSPSLGNCGNYGGVTGYYCHTAKDKCTDDADCQTQGGGDCRYDTIMGAWACAISQCAG